MNRKDLKDYKYNQEWIKEQMEYIEELNSTINRLTTTLSDMPKGSKSIYDIEAEKKVELASDDYTAIAKTILEGLKSAGYTVSGGVNAPYIWLKTPDKMTSWEFFDYLLEKANVVGTPGSGFGPSGEGYFRLTAFGSYENTVKALERIKAL